MSTSSSNSSSMSSSSSSTYPDETKDRLEVLFQQEVSFYLTSDYLSTLIAQQQQQQQQKRCDHGEGESGSSSSSSTSGSSKQLNQHWREVMCEWAYHVVDHFDFPRDIVSACMNFLDRYLSNHLARHNYEGIPKHAFQLLAMTCLYVAVKLDQPRMLSLDTMAHLSRGTFTKSQMQAMEMDILSNLNWHVHPPTPYTFLSYFMQLSKEGAPNATASTPQNSGKIYEMARYFVELSVLDYYFVGKRSSTIAIAALLNAVEDQSHSSTSSIPACQQHLYYFLQQDLASYIAPGQEELVMDCQARLRSLYNVPDQSVFDHQEQAAAQAAAAAAAATNYGRTSSPTCVSSHPMHA